MEMKFSEEMKKNIVLGYDRNVGAVEEYCIKQSISKASFYKWRRKNKCKKKRIESTSI